MRELLRLRHRWSKRVTRLAAGLLVAAAGVGCENLDRYGPADPASVPQAPTGLAAVPASSSAIALTWTASSGAAPLTYRVFRGGVAIGTTQSVEYGDDGLTPSTTYTYSVVAVDGFGVSSDPSNSANATTLGTGETDVSAPSAPTNLTAVAGSSTTIRLAWSPSSDDVGVLGYRIYRGGVQIGLSSGTEYTDQGLSPSTAYTYTVAAFDGAGHLSPESAPAQATTLATGATDGNAPTTPTLLVAVPAGPNAIGLTWAPSSDDVGVLGYRIYRGGVQIATSAITTFLDTGLSPATSYTYTVAAYDAAGNESPPSGPATATTLPIGQADTEAPSTPLMVVAVPSGPNGVLVSWAPAIDNVGVLGYRVFRDGVAIGTSGTPLYADGGLSPSTTYTYTVAAYDAAGNESAQSSGANATTLGSGVTDTEPPTVPSGLGGLGTSISITLSWGPSSDNVGVSTYVVYRDGVQIGTTVGTTFTDTGVWPSKAFSYTVAARDAAGNLSAQSSALVLTTLDVAVSLGTAGNFGLLAGAGVSLTGLLPTTVTGHVGSSPGISLLGLPLLSIIGGSLHLGTATAASAQVDLAAALAAISGVPIGPGNDLTGQPLGGRTLTAGVYQHTGAATLNGSITLNAGGDPSRVFVIVIGGDLTTAASASVVLANGAQPQNVFWVVSGSVSVGNGTTLRGSILATGNVTLGSGCTVVGRVLSRTGTVGASNATVGL